MTTSTASVVFCPNCGHQTVTYCGSKKLGVKIRYRKCGKCDTRVKTIQRLDDLASGEEIVPVLTQDEQNKFLAGLRAKQAARRAAMNRANKLSIREVAEIKFLVLNQAQTAAYTAMQYGVEKATIDRITTGVSFPDVPTPESLADL